MRITLDLGEEDDQEWLDTHLAAKGLGLSDVLAVTVSSVARRKGRRIYAYGRGLGGRPVVVVLMRTGLGWRPRTAWPMDEVERHWWREHGGR